MSSVRVLGPIEVSAGGRSLALGGHRQLSLLAFLVLHAGHAVSSDALIEAVWGPAPPGADKRLQMAIARLRKALEPLADGAGVRLQTVGGGYLLALPPGQLDADMFAEFVRDGHQALEAGDPASASELFSKALGLWRGPPLAEVAFENFAQGEIRRLEELRLFALETRADAELQLGRHGHLIGELESHLAAQPARERLAAQLMTALYRSGRQADALDVYQRTRNHLAEELGLEPGPALKALQAEILEHASALRIDHAEPVRRIASVPLPATETIGRRREIEATCRLLADGASRLVTLTGPGGVGKTRLAQMVAHELAVDFPDGVVWIELAGAARAEDVAPALARALALTPPSGESIADALRHHLANKRLLLAIDNFEHVLDAAVLIADLHAACPGVAILTTSREPLDLAAEHRVPVARLPGPLVSDTISVADLEAADAAALFLAAVRRRDPQFSPGPASAPAIARICAALDGLPLALELAAARTGLLTVQELADRLDNAFIDLGAGPRDAPARHRTLRATIDWSYRLLDRDQQRAFVRFAVFAGGATLDASLAVTGASLETLEALTAKSLIGRRRQADGTTRLTMLETVRADALRRLADLPDRAGVYRRHFDHYLELTEQLASRLSSHDERAALAALDGEIDNLTAALRWALDAAPNSALRLVGHLGLYWKIRGDPEALDWLDVALQSAGPDAPAQDRARAKLELAHQLHMRQRRLESDAAAEEALALYRLTDDHAGIARAWGVCAMVPYNAGDMATARAYAEAACRHARIAGDDARLGKAESTLAITLPPDERLPLLDHAGELLTRAGDFRELAGTYLSVAYTALMEDRVPEALRLLDVALSAAAKVDSPLTMVFVLGNIGLAKLFSGDLNEARTAFESQLRLCIGHAFRFGADEGLVGLGAVAAAEGHLEQAATLQSAGHALGYPQPLDEVIDDRLECDYFAPARASYRIEAWRQAEQAGAKMSYDEAIEYALAEPEPLPATVLQLRSSEARH